MTLQQRLEQRQLVSIISWRPQVRVLYPLPNLPARFYLSAKHAPAMTIKKINSRNKGASAERELAGLIHDHLGVRLVRKLDQCRCGGHDLVVAEGQSGEVVDFLDRFAIEVKRHSAVTRAKIEGFWAQAVDQADKANKIPLLALRADRDQWRFMLPMHDDYCEVSYHQFFYMARECVLPVLVES